MKQNTNKNETYIRSLFELDEWKLIQNELYFHSEDSLISESLTSIGNNFVGMRGNYEEKYSGAANEGSYLGGVWFPEENVMTYWKTGYPEYFGRTANSTNFIKFKVKVDEAELDTFVHRPTKFNRTLNMKNGNLTREFEVYVNNKKLIVETKRFLSIVDREMAIVEYKITAGEESFKLDVTSLLDSSSNNYLKKDSDGNSISFWKEECFEVTKDKAYVQLKTKQTKFNTERYTAGWAMKTICSSNNAEISPYSKYRSYGHKFTMNLGPNESVKFTKYVSISSSRYVDESEIRENAFKILEKALRKGADEISKENDEAWAQRWSDSDICIVGDVSSQQAIRYNMFQLFCTYDGFDFRLNIGPKGFTGEKYGGATYWDTEGYCLPLYLATNSDAAKSMLEYRFNQLPQAYHNARMQQLDGALYPMVTFDGIESHNEWEITFEELHRNTTIAYAILDYVNFTKDEQFMKTKGIVMLIEIARFWVSRVHWNKNKQCFMIHGITGPNEFDHHVANNWYTNYGAKWVIEKTMCVINKMEQSLIKKLELLRPLSSEELKHWKDVALGCE